MNSQNNVRSLRALGSEAAIERLHADIDELAPEIAVRTCAGRDAPAYLLGHSEPELQRLSQQAEILRPVTARLLAAAGLRPGMSVLDLGCGAGDVSLLAAEIVGRHGRVLGVDQDGGAVACARRRAAQSGVSNTAFELADIAAVERGRGFDLVVGRYVLVHQPDPTETVRIAASYAKPGGVVAFHEFILSREPLARPPVLELDRLWEICVAACRALLPSPDVGSQLVRHFVGAGLPSPHVLAEAPAGDACSPVIPWLLEALRALRPGIEELGLPMPDEFEIGALGTRLVEEARAVHAQLVMPLQVCAWAAA